MRLGLFISVLLHAALLAWALVSIAAPRDFKDPQPDPIVADVISPSDLARMRQGKLDAKLDDAEAKEVPKPDASKKETPKPKPPPPPAAAEPPPPAPEEPKPPEPVKAAEPPPPPKEEPKPEPDKAALDQKLEELALQQAKEEQAKAEAAAKAKAAAEAKAKADAEAKAKAEAIAKAKAIAKARADKARADAKAKAEAKAKADAHAKSTADRVAALLDKTPDAQQAPASAPPSPTPSKAKGPVRGAEAGRDSVNEGASLIGSIINQIHTRGCWNIQAGGELASNQVPKVQFELTQDGMIRGEPRVLNSQSSPHFQLAADAAKSALIKCQPFSLPPDKYHLWRKVTLDFDPAEMFR